MNNEITLGKMTVLGSRETQILLSKVESLQIKTALQSPKTFRFQEPRRINRSLGHHNLLGEIQKLYTVFVPKIENRKWTGVGGQDTGGEGAWERLTAPVTSAIFKDGSTAQIPHIVSTLLIVWDVDDKSKRLWAFETVRDTKGRRQRRGVPLCGPATSGHCR